MAIVTIGLDTAKSWFQVHGVDESGRVVLRRKLARGKVLPFFAGLTPCVIGLEACGGAHFWARELIKLGHDARLMPARYVRAYVKTNKHDAADAEACCEAVQRPGMRFVPVKSEEQQSMLMVHRTRDLLVRQRTATVNALRGHLAEFGITAARGTAKARELMSLVGTDERVPAIAREALLQLVEQIRDIERKIEAFDKQLLSLARQNEVCRQLITIPGIGPIAATALVATVGNARSFTSGRHFAAWIGLVPKQHSTGGKERLGGISKRGDAYLRKLLIHGARAAVHRVRSHQVPGAWIAGLLARRPFNVATVALANKTARIAWAVMTNGSTYRAAA
ncbi:MAG: IS110 family transposase [Pseudomonadota bacterium]|nr:IS110 family transposase [Pseudomonadota bacterium]